MASGGKRTGSGRKATPTRLRLLRGNPQRRPLNALEPDPARGVPDAPRWFNVLQLEGWETMVRALEPMGVLTISDGPALAILAQAWAEWREAEATVAVRGAYYETPMGGSTSSSSGEQQSLPGCAPKDDRAAGGVWIRAHPAVAVAANAWRRVASMLAEFGLTPAARARLQVAPQDEPDAFAEFQRRRPPRA